MSEFETHQFGFRWGPAWVTRVAHIKGKGYVLTISTHDDALEVWVSEKGKSLRATTRSGRELK